MFFYTVLPIVLRGETCLILTEIHLRLDLNIPEMDQRSLDQHK